MVRLQINEVLEMGFAKKAAASLGDLHVGRTPRRWPLSYFFVALLIIVLLPQIFYKGKQQAQSLKRRKSIFGDNLHPTPWHWHANDVGTAHRSWQRSFELLKCSYPGWVRPSHPSNKTESSEKCPDYFRWIKKDLSPWERTGITATNIEMAKESAAFKVIILNGRLYVDLYWSCVQTRAPFTIWGLLLLLERFEGKIPDVEILFDCMDRPQIRKPPQQTDGSWSPAPLFRYCSNKWHYDIPWPDWSFWGWAETELDPWEQEVEKITKGSRRKAWRFKDPRAFWRGNPNVASPMRMELLQCNNATRYPKSEIVQQVWGTDSNEEKINSKLENQCKHRYKIYAEGYAWSVSFKYIMACGSPTLVISPKYYDFFMRGLQPGVHYIPVRPADICANHLCTALDWGVRSGERDELKAIRIGEAGFKFVHEEVSMARVYDYMYHMLRSYAALQRFKPALPRTAREVTQKFVLCGSKPHERRLLERSKRAVPWFTPPCSLDFNEGGEESPKNFFWEDDAHVDDGWSTRDCTAVRRTDPWNPNPRKGRDKKRPKQPKKKPPGDTLRTDAAMIGKDDNASTKRESKDHPRTKSGAKPRQHVEKKEIPYQEQNATPTNKMIPKTQDTVRDPRRETADSQQDPRKETLPVPNEEKDRKEKAWTSESTSNLMDEPAKPDSEAGANTKKDPQEVKKSEKVVLGEVSTNSNSRPRMGNDSADHQDGRGGTKSS